MKELGGAQRQESSYKDQIASMTTETNAVAGLAEKGNYPRNKLLALQRERTRLEGQLGALEGDMARNREVIAEARLQMRQAEQQYADEASHQLPEVRTRLSDAREKLAVADDIMTRVEVRAPQAGIVQGLKVLSPGAVVKPGEALAELVPTGDKLVMSVRASPLDIDSIEPGQNAEIRFPAFATREFPIILGTVDRVAADAMHDEVTKEPYYLVRVLVDPATVPELVLKRLVPGMPADVLISTGERTILQYLVGPLSNLFAKSMREM